MKDKIKESWYIFNDYFKNGQWFWATVIIGVVLLGIIIWLAIAYTKTLL